MTFGQEENVFFPSANDTIIIKEPELAILQEEYFIDLYLARMVLDSLVSHFPGMEPQKNQIFIKDYEIEAIERLIQEKEFRVKLGYISQINMLLDRELEEKEKCLQQIKRSFQYRKQRNFFIGSSLLFGITTIILSIAR
ncbi:MAG: hypothetical protein ACOCUL_00240 [Bacteroidota bacterium]